MPFIPFFIIVGVAGWDQFKRQSGFWLKNKKLYRSCLIFFWSLNGLFLILVSPQYTKKSRVESMYYLRSLTDVKGFIMESSNNKGVEMPPRYYYGRWEIPSVSISKTTSLNDVKNAVDLMPEGKPNYIFFCEDENKDTRMNNITTTLNCRLSKVKDFEPSLLDNVFYILNPLHNINQRIELYRIEYL